jgi:hypothetical protein
MQRTRGSQEAGRSRAISRGQPEITREIHKEVTEFTEGSFL